MFTYILTAFVSISLLTTLSETKPQPTGLVITQTLVEGTPGATFFNQITLTNPTDQNSQVRLQLTLPPAFRLLSRLPASVTLPPHSSRQMILKFLIDREWDANEAIVRLETSQAEPNTLSTIQFVVQPSRTLSSALTFALLDESPYLTSGQDTLPLAIRFSNQGVRPRTVRLQLFSTPDGFRLPQTNLTISARRDTVVHLPVLVRNNVQFDRSYEVAIELQDADGSMLGSVICRPILLASVKRFDSEHLMGLTPNGVSVGLSRFGTTGMARELKLWGEEKLAKGTVRYQAHYLNFMTQRYHDLRDTYVQYQQDQLMVRAGSLYDMHELPLIGVGIKLAYAFDPHTKLEAWALRNQPNWLAGLTNRNSPLSPGPSTADMTYSIRLSGRLPLPGEADFSFSSNYYSQRRYNRVGILNFATMQWQPNRQSAFRLTAGQNMEYATDGSNRQRTLGWAIGGGYDRIAKWVDIRSSIYFSSPTYAGIQRGASLIDHSLTYKRWDNARLSYHISQVRYNQQFRTSSTETANQFYSNTIAEIIWSQERNRLTWVLRPYYWQQVQSLPKGILQRADSYRVMTSLRYETLYQARFEAGIDGGQFVSKEPSPERFSLPSYRYFGSIGFGKFNVMGSYQQGLFLINDRLPEQGDPRSFRQISMAPSLQFALLDGRLRANFGAGLAYNSQVKSWNGLLFNSATYAVNDNLRLRVEVNALSFAEQLTEISSVPWRETQARVEVTKLFRRMPWNTTRSIRLRFFEDDNGNQQKDSHERYMEGLVVHVGETALITDTKGTITYKGMMAGVYPFRTVSRLSTGEPVWFQDTIRVVKSAQRDIPIRKTLRISGQLRCNRAKYENQSCEFDQHRIEAFGKSGEVYRTYADEQGHFTLYLPIGQYQVNVSMARVLRKMITYQIEPGQQAGELQVDLEPAGRKVQIKRFTSK